jgi:purine-binding chemotaxis protein CheW
VSTEVLESAATVRACLFVLAGQRFAVDLRCAREVVVVEEFTIVPRGPAYLVGVANLRGYVLSIVDISSFLGLPPRPVGRGTLVLVIEAASAQVGVPIDAILGIESVEEILPVGDSARRTYGELAAGLMKSTDRVVTLLDAANLLTALRRDGEGE